MSARLNRWSDAAEFWRLYGYLARALALRRAVHWGARTLLIGLGVMVAFVVAARVLTLALPPLPLLFTPAALCGLLGVIFGYVKPQRPERTVRLADARLDLKDRLTTALELVRNGGAHPLASLQVADAVTHFADRDPFAAFPVRVPPRTTTLALALALLLPLVTLVPNPFAAPPAAPDRSREIARQEAARLDQLARQLAQAQHDQQAAQIQHLLEDASRALGGDQPPDQSLATLTDLEQRLYQMGDGDQGLDAALAALSASLAGTPGQQDLAKRLSSGDLKQVSQDLRRLAQDQRQLDAAQRQQLARALQQAAANAARSNPALARSLQQAGEGMQQGGQQGADQAQQALDQAADQAQQAGEQQQALAQAQQSRDNLARALGDGSRLASGQNGAQQPQQGQGHQGQQPRAGNQPGQGQQGQGQPGQGQSGQGQPGDRSTGEQQGQTGDGTQPGNQPGDQPGGSAAGQGESNGRDRVYDPLFSGSHPEQVPGQGQAQASEVSQDPYLSPAQQNGSQVGYQDVYGKYQQRAVQNIDQSPVPLGLKDLVRQYFDELDPNAPGGK